VPQDYQEAVKWHRLAAAQGNQFAQTNLGEMYTNGTGVRQDFVRAHMWFTLPAAALSGDFGDTATKNRDRVASKLRLKHRHSRTPATLVKGGPYWFRFLQSVEKL
jgi:uncharacterized protein